VAAFGHTFCKTMSDFYVVFATKVRLVPGEAFAMKNHKMENNDK
jgi:hypothetical protein